MWVGKKANSAKVGTLRYVKYLLFVQEPYSWTTPSEKYEIKYKVTFQNKKL
jgi:hypothetical protein